MSDFNDEAIEQGVRKRAKYEDSRRATLALKIERTDGGEIKIPLLYEAKTTVEEQDIQQNTLLAIMPLARLPGERALDSTPTGALLRAGRLYVFYKNQLWRELEADGAGNLSEIDLNYWRNEADQSGQADERPAVGVSMQVILVPTMLHGQAVGNDVMMAYSEQPWTWEYIEWLEADAQRIESRCSHINPAWAAAYSSRSNNTHDTSIWTASDVYPAIPIDADAPGMRARDLSVETALEEATDFTPDFAHFTEDTLVGRTHQLKAELINALKRKQNLSEKPASSNHSDDNALVIDPTTTVEALPEVLAGEDILAKHNLRAYPMMAGLMLEDPLFELRHAIAQAQHAQERLQVLNALVPHQHHGEYAHLLYTTVMQRGEHELAQYQSLINKNELNVTIFDGERREIRQHLERQLTRIIRVVNAISGLPVVLNDWVFTEDERLFEPFALLTEVLNTLAMLPSSADALHTVPDVKLESEIRKLTTNLLLGRHPMTQHLLSSKPEIVQRLLTLLQVDRMPNPDKVGVSTLLNLIDSPGAEPDSVLTYRGIWSMADDLFNTFITGVSAHIARMHDQLEVIVLQRIFSHSFNTLHQLVHNWQGIELVSQADAKARGMVILGVSGGGLRNGLTPDERRRLTRNNYQYANLLNETDERIGSTSPRQAGSHQKLDSVKVVAVPKDHPEADNIARWKYTLHRKLNGTLDTPAIPAIAFGFALYNLHVNIAAFKGLQHEGANGRAQIGSLSAFVDLTVASASLYSALAGDSSQLVQRMTKPRIAVARISKGWARNLDKQTGSSRLPLLRGASGFAMGITTFVTAWDATRAWQQGDQNAALAYGVSAAGGAVWTASILGMAINPFALVVGATLFIGGAVLGGLFTDSDIETLLKNGPFGQNFADPNGEDQDARFTYLQNQQQAYTQLQGVLGQPQLRVQRYQDWCASAPAPLVQRLDKIQAERMQDSGLGNYHPSCVSPEIQPFDNDDWVVIIRSPLLAMFKGEQYFRLYATERQSVLSLTGAFNAPRVSYHDIVTAKLQALPLDNASVLYILPHQLPRAELSPLGRHRQKVQQGLRIRGQFHLSQQANTNHTLVLPQPNPKRWRAFTEQDRRVPPVNTDKSDAPYWFIEHKDFDA